MFAIRFNTLGENKYLTDAKGNVRQFEDNDAALLVVDLFSEYYGAEVVPSPMPGTGVPQDEQSGGTFTGSQFTAKRNEETDKWGVWDNKAQKWAGENMNNREQARSLAKILNSQTAE